MKTILIFSFVFSLVASQPPISPLSDLSSSAVLIQVLNYFGCKTWKDGICIECSDRFYFNEKSICCEVKPNCEKFNRIMGSCEKCYKGYELVDEKCVLIDLQNEKNRGCKVWQDSHCKECSFKYYLKGINCERIDDLCSKWNERTGECLQCYRGYVFEENSCILNPLKGSFLDPLCKQWKNQVCLSCAERAYFDENGKCKQVSPNCRTWDRFDGSCLTCYKGYQLYKQFCVLSATETEQPHDKGCSLWDWDNQVCLKCSPTYLMNDKGVCQKLDDLCKEYFEDKCVSCYKGYILVQNKCTIDPKEIQNTKDKNCALWDWENSACLKCAPRTAFNFNGICVSLSDLCRQFNEDVCIQCYLGYKLIDGVCEVDKSFSSPATDPSCSVWDWENKICVKCSFRYYRDQNGLCLKIDNNCKLFEESGLCKECYSGYKLERNNKCEAFQFQLKDKNCAQWDWENQLCFKCKIGAFFDENGICTQKSDLCKAIDRKGVCIECYKGYILLNGKCFIQIEEKIPDDFCAVWNWEAKKCQQCSPRTVKNRSGLCVKVNDLCKDYDLKGDCLSCYRGYKLQNGQCKIKNVETTRLDLGCAEWDWDNLICLKCSFRYYFDEFGFCIEVDPHCKDFDQNGNCFQCYKGYEVKNKVCQLSVLTNTHDKFCAQWDWDSQICLRCSPRAVFDAFGFCTPVSDFCKTFSQIGDCQSCYKGYELIDGNCVLSEHTLPLTEVGCASWDWENKICLKCSFRYFFNNSGICEQVSDLCNTFDDKGNCLSCYMGYRLANGECVQLNFLCKQGGLNGYCESCFDGYVLLKGKCQPLSLLADLALYYMECCPEKLEKLRKEGRLP